MLGRTTQSAATVLGALLVSACVSVDPQVDSNPVPPRAEAVRSITSFSSSLSCMDDLFQASGVRNVVITSTGLPDETGKINAGTKDMLISAVSRMSTKSQAVTFVDFDQSQTDVAALQRLVGFTDEFRVPTYYIRGAITQLDQAAPPHPGRGSPTSGDAVARHNVVSLDMNMGRVVSRQIIPGIFASNSIAVSHAAAAGDASAAIDKADVTFRLSFNRDKGVHQAVRTLIELSAIEILGKLVRVPYWRCLQIDQTSPEVMAQAMVWFSAMSAKERIAFAQGGLRKAGLYKGSASGSIDGKTRDAIGRYQVQHQLIPSGRVDFDLYWALLGENPNVLGGQEAARPRSAPKHAVLFKLPTVGLAAPKAKAARAGLSPPKPAAPWVGLVTARGRAPVYRPGEKLEMTVTTSDAAHLYCYYRDAHGRVARIFPNRLQADSYLAAGERIVLPGKNALFDIVFDQPRSKEEVLCMASPREVGLALPESFKVPDLTPLPVRSLAAVVRAFRKIDQKSLAVAHLPITVTE